jgi:hypothetical protein
MHRSLEFGIFGVSSVAFRRDPNLRRLVSGSTSFFVQMLLRWKAGGGTAPLGRLRNMNPNGMFKEIFPLPIISIHLREQECVDYRRLSIIIRKTLARALYILLKVQKHCRL